MEKLNELLSSPDTAAELVELRRELHRFPEIGGEEVRTQTLICRKLSEWGIAHEKIADTGVVALIEGEAPGRVVGLRADIDALPINEETSLPYASEIPDRMHACGHDAHTAILLVTAHVLSRCRDSFHGAVKLFFQPAEESFGGAERMIAAGCLEDPRVDCVLGLHVSTALPTGRIGVKYGGMYAASDMFEIRVHGESCHGANPSAGVDAIVIGAAIVTQLQTLVSRSTSPLDNAVVSVGSFHGGRVRNQIADSVVMEGIIRTLKPETRIYLRNRAREVVEGVAAAMGGRAEFLVTPSYCSVVNDDAMVDTVRRVGTELLGEENVIIESEPSLGCEDFAYFAAARPGAFWHLGCRNESLGAVFDTHSCNFAIDEDALLTGVKMHIFNVLELLK